MTRQAGLFDVDERLSDIGDQLEAFAAVVDFEMFRPELVAALRYGDGAKGGRPPFDPVMMFKILVIQAQNNLGDDRAEFLINDRLSFMRFLGLGLTDRVPDAKTIWAFRERLTKAGAIEALFVRFEGEDRARQSHLQHPPTGLPRTQHGAGMTTTRPPRINKRPRRHPRTADRARPAPTHASVSCHHSRLVEVPSYRNPGPGILNRCAQPATGGQRRRRCRRDIPGGGGGPSRKPATAWRTLWDSSPLPEFPTLDLIPAVKPLVPG